MLLHQAFLILIKVFTLGLGTIQSRSANPVIWDLFSQQVCDINSRASILLGAFARSVWFSIWLHKFNSHEVDKCLTILLQHYDNTKNDICKSMSKSAVTNNRLYF